LQEIRNSQTSDKGYPRGILLNEIDEAYTGYPIGRRGDCTSPKQFSPEMCLVASDDAFICAEINTAMIVKGEIIVEMPGSKSVACWKRSIRNLGDPVFSLRYKGKNTQLSRRYSDGIQGVRLLHSTQRR